MRIGLFGFDFVSSNKGCEALTYTFLSMIERLCRHQKLEVLNFTYNDSLGLIPEQYPHIVFKRCKINLKNPSFLLKALKKMKTCDAFFDATFGDGFSDIYGEKWNVKTNLIKQIVIWSGTPLILLPQTYGPYSNKNLEKWALHLIRKAKLVYSRDDFSAEYIKRVSGNKIKVASDMAFKLPFDKNVWNFEKNKTHVGINVSSLLWDSEWAKENHFGLTVDYRAFHTTLIEELIADSKYQVHMIPHVIDLDNPETRENDYRICQKMKDKYGGKVILAPPFDTPIEAKSYISKMDVFIGSRMHATIGSISSGVATIPFSYSRKFEGLFGNLNYPYVISARKETTEEALMQVKKWFSEIEVLKNAGDVAVVTSLQKLEVLERDIQRLLK